MTENQELKFKLLSKFANIQNPETLEFCKAAYEWLVTEPIIAKEELPDGIYYVLADFNVVPFIPGKGLDGSLDVSQVRYVGIKCGSHSFKVALHDVGGHEKVRLTSVKDQTNYDGNKNNYLDAIADWNGKVNTDHLKAIDLNKEIALADGEYIPSLAEMYLIYLHRKALNQALELIGSDPIKDDWYWSSTESSAANAWYLNLIDGYTHTGCKTTYICHVRPVSSFIV